MFTKGDKVHVLGADGIVVRRYEKIVRGNVHYEYLVRYENGHEHLHHERQVHG